MRKIKEFFNVEIIKNLDDLILNNPILFNLNYKFYREIYCFSRNIWSNIDKLNEIIYSIEDDNQLIYLVSFIYSVNNGIRKIKIKAKEFLLDSEEYSYNLINFVNKEIFYKNWKNSFLEGFGVKESEINNAIEKVLKNDNIFFNYLRTMIVHPFDIQNAVKFGWILNNNEDLKYATEFFSEYTEGLRIQNFKLSNNKILFNLTTLKNHSENWSKKCSCVQHDEFCKYDEIDKLIYFDLKDLIEYAKNQYETIQQIYIWLKWLEKEYYKKVNKIVKNWSKNNIEFLKQIVEIINKKYINTNFFNNLLEEYNAFINKELTYDNYKIVSEYFNDIFSKLRKIKRKFKSIDKEKLFNIENDIIELYSIEKYSNIKVERLHGKRIEIDPYNKNIFDGLVEAKSIFNDLAHKYTIMDIDNSNLNFFEIRLLIKVSLWRFKKENKIN